MINVRNVSKTLGSNLILDGISLMLNPGKTSVLIGPSGCGKTTLLKLMVGLLWSDEGSIEFDGQQITPENIFELRQRFGYVIQNGGLFPHLTVRQNVSLMPEFLNHPAQQTNERIAELAKLTHLSEDLLERYPAQISGGQRQRVSLMRALMLDPEVLFLDEPLGALDPLVRADLQQELREIFRSLNKSVILVTHDLREADFFADEIILLKDGQIAQQGQLADFSTNPASPFVSRFVGAHGFEVTGAESGAS
jgi:osmoprotectant transport system ATP-binding protein